MALIFTSQNLRRKKYLHFYYMQVFSPSSVTFIYLKVVRNSQPEACWCSIEELQILLNLKKQLFSIEFYEVIENTNHLEHL